MIDILQWVLSFILALGATFAPPIIVFLVLSGFTAIFKRGKPRKDIARPITTIELCLKMKRAIAIFEDRRDSGI